MNFYIADTHFGHSNIIRLNNRPFSNVEEMDAILVQNWNKKVTSNDTVYIIGDFSYRSEKDPIGILKSLNGTKVLIEGNHDRHNLNNPEFRKEFKSIGKMQTIYDGNTMIVLCHYPIVEWDGYFKDSYLIFGHIHNNTRNRAYKVMYDEPKALNAGVDIINYEPVTFEELVRCNRLFKESHPVSKIGD